MTCSLTRIWKKKAMVNKNRKLLILIGVAQILILLFTACRPATTPTPAPGIEHEKPALSNTLERNCQPSRPDGRNQFDNAGLEVGEKAVDFTLRATDGTALTLSELLAEKPVMMVFGSFT